MRFVHKFVSRFSGRSICESPEKNATELVNLIRLVIFYAFFEDSAICASVHCHSFHNKKLNKTYPMYNLYVARTCYYTGGFVSDYTRTCFLFLFY